MILTPHELDQALQRLPGWSVVEDRLHWERKFPDFTEAFAFMTLVAAIAERLDHHPDWSNSYGTVRIDLVTHSEGGITAKDVELALAICGL